MKMILALFIFVGLWFASAGIQILFITEIKRDEDDDLSILGIIVFLPAISLGLIVQGIEILINKIGNSKLTNLLFKKRTKNE